MIGKKTVQIYLYIIFFYLANKNPRIKPQLVNMCIHLNKCCVDLYFSLFFLAEFIALIGGKKMILKIYVMHL